MGSKYGTEQHLAALMRAAQAGDRGAYTTLLCALGTACKGGGAATFRFPAPAGHRRPGARLCSPCTGPRHLRSGPPLPALADGDRSKPHGGQCTPAMPGVRPARCRPGTPPETFPAEDTNMSANGYGDAEALAQAMTKLPQSQRQAIELMKLREMSLKEAAAATGTSIGLSRYPSIEECRRYGRRWARTNHGNDEFINRLAADLRPVRPLWPPWARAVLWLGIALPYVAAVVWSKLMMVDA